MDYTVVTIPEPQTADISYGYNSEPLKWVQIDPSNNRNISWMQYFAFDVQATSGTVATGLYRDIIFTGKNWDLWKLYTQLFYGWLWAGNEITWTFTKRYTTDTFYELNESVNQAGWIIRIPSWKIAEIQTAFNSSTQRLRLNVLAGSYRFLFWSSLDFSSTNTNTTIINKWTTDLQLRMQFATTASDRPIFWILIKIF